MLVDHDLAMLVTLNEELSELEQAKSWRSVEELLALIVEMLSTIRTEQLLIGGVKPRDVPKVMRVPRPEHLHYDTKEPEVRTITPREYARMVAVGS